MEVRTRREGRAGRRGNRAHGDAERSWRDEGVLGIPFPQCRLTREWEVSGVWPTVAGVGDQRGLETLPGGAVGSFRTLEDDFPVGPMCPGLWLDLGGVVAPVPAGRKQVAGSARGKCGKGRGVEELWALARTLLEWEARRRTGGHGGRRGQRGWEKAEVGRGQEARLCGSVEGVAGCRGSRGGGRP